ncbi:MAG TPA: flagellin [Candidatus Thermoplasmatota archaeon]|nr:flagellin [Candidatus Thermoplasmatota archaeon]
MRRSQNGAMGIGVMIIFIAMVLVAGIVAYAIFSTGSLLEIQSGSTGSQTIKEVSSGLKVSTIQGHNTSGLIDKMVILIIPRAGSPEIDLNGVLIELSDSDQKNVLEYSSLYWVDGTAGLDNLFDVDAFPSVSSEYGVIVLIDDDDSCNQTTPVINRGDSMMLALNTTVIFGGIGENVNIAGNVIPEEGAWSIIQFRTPSSFVNPILILQQD